METEKPPIGGFFSFDTHPYVIFSVTFSASDGSSRGEIKHINKYAWSVSPFWMPHAKTDQWEKQIKRKRGILVLYKLLRFRSMSIKTILYIAMSADGFIAGENNNIDFLNPYQIEDEDYGYNEFINSVGNIIVGRKTYEKVIGMGFPYHPDKTVYVATRSSIQSDTGSLIYYNGNFKSLISKLKSSQHKNIYCDGGAELAKSLIAEDLIDEIIVSVISVKLESGILLFENGMVPDNFSLKKKQAFKTGLIQYSYVLTKRQYTDAMSFT